MRRFLVTAGTVLALGGVSATGALAADPHNQNGSLSTGQPSQSCQNTAPPAFPGNTGTGPGSAFTEAPGASTQTRIARTGWLRATLMWSRSTTWPASNRRSTEPVLHDRSRPRSPSERRRLRLARASNCRWLRDDAPD